MEAFLGGRKSLSFVKTAVLTSADGGNTFKDEKVDELKDETGRALTGRELGELQKGSTSNMTLYERLEKNKEEKHKLWEEKHGAQAPKALDEDDVLFLNEELRKEDTRRRQRVAEEENEIKAFRIAQNSSKISNEIRKVPQQQAVMFFRQASGLSTEKKEKAMTLIGKRKRIGDVKSQVGGEIISKSKFLTASEEAGESPISEETRNSLENSTNVEKESAKATPLDFLGAYESDSSEA